MPMPTFTAGRRLRASELATVATKVDDLALPSQCIARRVANQVVVSGGGGVDISWDTEDTDTDAMFAPTSTTITIKKAGKYQVTVYGVMAGTGQVWQVNHSAGPTIRARMDGVAQVNMKTSVFTAAVNDTVKVGVFQSSGGNQNLTATISVIKVSD